MKVSLGMNSKLIFFFLLGIFLNISLECFAQVATVNVSLSPAGSFVIKSTEVKGLAEKKGDLVSAKGITVGLKSITTGITLRDDHTKKHLEVVKFPEAVLVSATGKNGKGEGIIKIRGIEKKITGDYKIEGKTLKANFKLSLADFKLTNLKYMGVGVDDSVELNVSVPLK